MGGFVNQVTQVVNNTVDSTTGGIDKIFNTLQNPAPELSKLWENDLRPGIERTMPWVLAPVTGGKSLELYAQWKAGEDAKAYAEEQRRIQQEQMKLQKKQAEAQNIQNIRNAVRQQRMQMGQLTNQAAGGGVAGASGTLGAAGAVSSGMSGELTYFNTMGNLQNQSNALTLQSAQAGVDYAGRQADTALLGGFGRLMGSWSIPGAPKTGG